MVSILYLESTVVLPGFRVGTADGTTNPAMLSAVGIGEGGAPRPQESGRQSRDSVLHQLLLDAP